MLGNSRVLGWAAAGLVGAALAGIAISFVSGVGAPTTLVAAGPLLSSGETVVGERIVYPTETPAKVSANIVTLEPGQETGWHTHGMPVFGYVLEGELEVDYGDHGSKVYRAGDAVLEAIGVIHNGRNVGRGRVRILAVFMGAEGLSPTVSRSQ